MYRLSIFGVAALSISPANCQGTAFIQNWCDFEVYVWSVANVPNYTINYLAPIIGDFSETYRTNPNGGGISLKIATIPNNSYITQFEYTYSTDNPNVYYDISNVNGYPFEIWGLALSPSTPSAPFCSSISCDLGVALCPDAFNEFSDNYAVRACDVSTDLTLTLCPFQTTMATATEPVTATIMTTDAGGNAFPSTLTTVLTPVEPATTPESQTTMVTATETVTTIITTNDAGGNTVVRTLTTALTFVEPTTILESQTTMITAEETTFTTVMTGSNGNIFPSTITEVFTPVETTTTIIETTIIIIATTDPGGNIFQSTRTTVLTLVELTTIPPSQTTVATATGTTLATLATTVTGDTTLPCTLTTAPTPVETTTFALAEVVTETVVKTDTRGNVFVTTITTVLTYPR
jgi:hypothetical protein